MNDKAFYEPRGNNTEVALLKFLQDAELPVQDDIKVKVGKVQYQVPFSSLRKNSAIAIKQCYDDGQDYIRIYVKGAPEQLVYNCVQTFDQSGQPIHLDSDYQNYIVSDVITQNFCQKGLRCLGFAFKDYTVSEFE